MPRGVYDRSKSKEQRAAEKGEKKAPSAKRSLKAAGKGKGKQFVAQAPSPQKGETNRHDIFVAQQEFNALHSHIAGLINFRRTDVSAFPALVNDEIGESLKQLSELRKRTFAHLDEVETVDEVEKASSAGQDDVQEAPAFTKAPVQAIKGPAPAPVIPTGYAQAPVAFNPNAPANGTQG